MMLLSREKSTTYILFEYLMNVCQYAFLVKLMKR